MMGGGKCNCGKCLKCIPSPNGVRVCVCVGGGVCVILACVTGVFVCGCVCDVCVTLVCVYHGVCVCDACV